MCIEREGVASKPSLNRLMNPFTDCIKLEIDFMVGKTKYLQTILRKDTAPFTVVQKPLFSNMLRSVQFYDQLCTRAVEISNKRFNNALFVNFYGIVAQKLIP